MSITLRRVRTAIIAAFVAAGALAIAAPAAAHDDLVGTTPESGASLTEVPGEIVFEFTGEIFAEGTAAQILGADGTDYAAGAVTVSGFTAAIPVSPSIPSGAYTATIHVVSSDGHPIEKEMTFTLALPEAEVTAAPEETEAPAATPDETAEPEMTAYVTDEPVDEPSALPWLIGAAAAVLVAGVIVAIVVARRRAS